MKNLTPSMVETLRWYDGRANNGRGRITGDDRRLLDGGWLTLTHTSMVTWVLTLSAKGCAVLDASRPREYTIADSNQRQSDFFSLPENEIREARD